MPKVAALLLMAVLLAAPVAGAVTITLGRGVGPWRLGQKFERAPGLLRSERHPGNDGPGCDFGPRTASRIDYYRTLRLSWRGLGPRKLYLIDVATWRTGNRSGDGFVIGRSRFGEVRRAHPKAALSFPAGRFKLGRTALTLIRKTGPETWVTFTYWFNRRGRLIALETSAAGC